MTWYLEVIFKYAQFSGRARRKEYWYFILFNLVISILLGVTDGLMGTAGATAGIGFLGAYSVGTFLPSLAVLVRRLHDTSRSGWWILFGFAPLIGPVGLLVFTLMDGDPGSNRFGADPKGDRNRSWANSWPPEASGVAGVGATVAGPFDAPAPPPRVSESVAGPMEDGGAPAWQDGRPRLSGDYRPPGERVAPEGRARVSFAGGSATRVRAVSATVSGTDAVAQGFLEFLASLPYDGADPKTAREWVTANLARGGETTIGGARFILSGPSGGRSLDILGLGPI